MKRELVYCRVSKADVYKDTRGCLCYTCETCPELKEAQLKKEPKPKEKLNVYRKRPQVKHTVCKDKRSLTILKNLEKLIKFEDSNEKLLQFLIDLGNNGANLLKINKALDNVSQAWYKKTKTFNLLRNFKTDFFNREKAIRNAYRLWSNLEPVFPFLEDTQHINKVLQELQSKLKEFPMKEYLDYLLMKECLEPLGKELGGRDIKLNTTYDDQYRQLQELYSKFKELANRTDDQSKQLKTEVYQEFQSKLKELANGTDDRYRQLKTKVLLQAYTPEKIRQWLEDPKPAQQNTHGLFTKAIAGLVDELKRVYKTDKTAYKETAKPLNLMYPEVYKDTNPDRVRATYTYHKNSQK